MLSTIEMHRSLTDIARRPPLGTARRHAGGAVGFFTGIGDLPGLVMTNSSPWLSHGPNRNR